MKRRLVILCLSGSSSSASARFAGPRTLRCWSLMPMNGSSSVNQHCPGQNVHHLQWCTKYRFEMLRRPEFYMACEASLKSAAQRHGIELVEVAVMSDHVHVVAALRADMSPARAAMLLKGASAYDLFRFKPKFRRRYWSGHFWGRSYFHRSAGDADLATIARYVREDNDPRQRTLTAY